MTSQEKRFTCAEALRHVYLSDGRLRYHTSLCRCCFVTVDGMRHASEREFEPAPERPFDDSYECELRSVEDVRSTFVWCCFCVAGRATRRWLVAPR